MHFKIFLALRDVLGPTQIAQSVWAQSLLHVRAICVKPLSAMVWSSTVELEF